MNCLIPSGLAVHTREFNCLNHDVTNDNTSTVLFQRRHIEEIAKRLEREGHTIAPLEFDLGTGIMDRFIDLPPYPHQVPEHLRPFTGSEAQHLKCEWNGLTHTCFGLIIKKAG